MQFRSLTDIVSIKRTLGGAFSVFGRHRVFRGIPVEGDEEQEEEQEQEREKQEAQEEKENEEEGEGEGVEEVEADAGDDDPAAPHSPTSGSSEPCLETPSAGGGFEGSAPGPKAPNGGVAANGCGGASVHESAGDGSGSGTDRPSCRSSPRTQRGEEQVVDEVS